MSKAFTRESDTAVDEPARPAARESTLPPGARNYMTPAGAARLRAELDALVGEARPAALRAIAEAPSENDAAAARRTLLELDRRAQEISASLESAELVDPAGQDPTRVLFGATVTVRDEHDRELAWQIVGVDEADLPAGRVSWVSPLARALLNARVGDVVTLRTPRGEQELEVVAIAYR